MRISKHCAECLWDKQLHRSDDPVYLNEVRRIIDARAEDDTAPYLLYLFNRAYERRFGKTESYRALKRASNDYVLSMENEIREKIVRSGDPLASSMAYARIGNYIDFGAMNHVDPGVFLALLDGAALQAGDLPAYRAFTARCEAAEAFLLIADNCGEIVLDKLFLEQLRLAFPQLKCFVMVRGSEVLNDVTPEDAAYVGIDSLAEIVSTGSSVAGVIWEMLPAAAKAVIERADVILAKGQGNYESLSDQGRHIFYSLLCKCEVFTERFQVPPLTGILIEKD